MITTAIHIDVSDLLALGDPCPEHDSGDQAQITTTYSRTVKGGTIAFYATTDQLFELSLHFHQLAIGLAARQLEADQSAEVSA